jgi:hypothetical protein
VSPTRGLRTSRYGVEGAFARHGARRPGLRPRSQVRTVVNCEERTCRPRAKGGPDLGARKETTHADSPAACDPVPSCAPRGGTPARARTARSLTAARPAACRARRGRKSPLPARRAFVVSRPCRRPRTPCAARQPAPAFATWHGHATPFHNDLPDGPRRKGGRRGGHRTGAVELPGGEAGPRIEEGRLKTATPWPSSIFILPSSFLPCAGAGALRGGAASRGGFGPPGGGPRGGAGRLGRPSPGAEAPDARPAQYVCGMGWDGSVFRDRRGGRGDSSCRLRGPGVEDSGFPSRGN